MALFWKVMFLIVLLSSGLGAIGAIAKPGVDLLLTLGTTAQAGIFWWLCRRGERSVRFSRVMEGGGLLINMTVGAFLGRYLLAGFARDHALVTAEGALMADGYVSMVPLGGMAMMVAIRAALIPSQPRRTIIVTGLVGTPMILVTALVVPTAGGGLAWRSLDSGVLPWLPATAAMMRWDGLSARVWWSEHQAALDGDAVESTEEWRTVAIDGAHRSSPEPTG